ncbi:MAG: hypothetical protein BA864_14515 [Desulfuromonadales bacterium C00003093]|nr:MAG: hypothetical protein BA864_14515 [Desulfuromonadales bacterium C00003093]
MQLYDGCRSHSVCGVHYVLGCWVRTFWMGCRYYVATGFAPFPWVADALGLPGSHLRYGLQRYSGCGRTIFVGCRDSLADRTLIGGCIWIVAAVARDLWAAEVSWLRSHAMNGLHYFLGCRFARLLWIACSRRLFAQIFWVAEELWLTCSQSQSGLHLDRGCRFARGLGDAGLLWLCRRHLRGCNYLLADRISIGGCKVGMAAVAQIFWVAEELWLAVAVVPGVALNTGLPFAFEMWSAMSFG